jgi:hypothetical protein
MHRLVLEQRVRRLRSAQARYARIVDPGRADRLFDALVAPRGELGYRRAIGPVAAIVPLGFPKRCGIDSTLEQTLEGRIDRRLA